LVTLARPEKLPVAASAKMRICWNWSGPDEVSGASRPAGVGGGAITPRVGFGVGLGSTIAGSLVGIADGGWVLAGANVGAREVLGSNVAELVTCIGD